MGRSGEKGSMRGPVNSEAGGVRKAGLLGAQGVARPDLAVSRDLKVSKSGIKKM